METTWSATVYRMMVAEGLFFAETLFVTITYLTVAFLCNCLAPFKIIFSADMTGTFLQRRLGHVNL